MTHVVLDIVCEYCDFCFSGVSFFVIDPKTTLSAKCPNCNKLVYLVGNVGDINKRIPQNAVEVIYCAKNMGSISKTNSDGNV